MALSVAVLVSVLIASADPATAHSKLLSSTPDADASIDKPSSIELRFSGSVSDDLSSIEVRNGGGERLDSGKATYSRDSKDTISVAVRSGATGKLTVKWRAVFADGHAIDGAYGFSVASPDPSVSQSGAVAPDASATEKTVAKSTPPEDHAVMNHGATGHSEHGTQASSGDAVLASSSSGSDSNGGLLVVVVMLGALALISVLSIGLLRRLQVR